MTIKQRQGLLFLFGLIFSVTTPVIILFSQGYLFDFKNLRFVQAGGIFIKSLPPETLISFRPASSQKEKQITTRKSILASSGALIKNLLPQNYWVKVTPLNNPEISWQKQIKVEPLIVSKATRIVFPILEPKIETKTLSSATSSIKFISQPENHPQTFFFLDAQNNLQSYSLTNGELSSWFNLKTINPISPQDKLTRLIPSARLKNLLLETPIKKLVILNKQLVLDQSYFQLFLRETKTQFNQLRFYWGEDNDDGLIALTPTAGYFFNLQSGEYWPLAKEKIIGLGTGYYLTESGTLFSLDSNGKTRPLLKLKQKLLPASQYQIFPLKNNSFLLRGKDGPVILAQTEKTNPELGLTKIIASQAEQLTLSHDSTRLAFTERKKLFIYFLEDIFDDLLYQAGEMLFLKELDQLPQGLYFANHNWQLISAGENRLTFIEIDKRPPMNSYSLTIKEMEKPLWFENNLFYWLDQNNQLNSAQILP